MIIVADSGSTKTEWRIIERNGSVERVVTDGINPFHQRADDIETIISNSDLINFPQVNEIHFYGAGCNYPDKIELVKTSLSKFFTSNELNVQHDLIAAARSVCGNEEGIACILGTGSNSCFYDGKNILQSNPSLGYILGDEGSGAYIGKKVIQDFLYSKMPDSIHQKFADEFQLTTGDILDRVYSRYLPNRFLASFTRFVQENIQHPYMHGLVYEAFYDFIDKHLIKYNKYEDVKTSFVGSVAYYFQDILKKVLSDTGFNFGQVIESPIEGLVVFHQINSKALN